MINDDQIPFLGACCACREIKRDVLNLKRPR